jgi:hypothetical protein
MDCARNVSARGRAHPLSGGAISEGMDWIAERNVQSDQIVITEPRSNC